MVIAPELAMPSRACMAPPVAAIVAPLLLVTSPDRFPKPVMFVLAPELVMPLQHRQRQLVLGVVLVVFAVDRDLLAVLETHLQQCELPSD
jgi:hypothetical protein